MQGSGGAGQRSCRQCVPRHAWGAGELAAPHIELPGVKLPMMHGGGKAGKSCKTQVGGQTMRREAEGSGGVGAWAAFRKTNMGETLTLLGAQCHRHPGCCGMKHCCLWCRWHVCSPQGGVLCQQWGAGQPSPHLHVLGTQSWWHKPQLLRAAHACLAAGSVVWGGHSPQPLAFGWALWGRIALLPLSPAPLSRQWSTSKRQSAHERCPGLGWEAVGQMRQRAATWKKSLCFFRLLFELIPMAPRT